MYTKAKLYNLALGALLLQRQISNTDTDQSNECKVLNTHWEAALFSTLEDLDLDSTSSQKALELITSDDEDYPDWTYIYKYPSVCAFFRRIKSSAVTDCRSTHIDKQVRMYGDQKAIFTNEVDAFCEYIRSDIPISSLSASAGMAVAYRLASLSSPLIVGKGAERLRKEIEAKYVMAKADACETDQRENFNFVEPEVESEFVNERLS